MAHESRRHLWVPLRDSLRNTGATGDIDVYEDDGSRGRWGNGRRCLVDYDPRATHHVVLQDDAVIPQDLIAGIEAWLDILPPSILCLYSGRVKPWRRIHARHAQPPCWLSMQSVQWGPALVFPTSAIPGLVAFADRLTQVGNYDLKLSEANKMTHRLPVLVPSPSWVNHAATPSLVPGRSGTRHALASLGPDDSVFDWAPLGSARIIPVPEFARQPGGREHHQKELRKRFA